MEDVSPSAGDQKYDPLTVHHLEIGPLSADEAERYGFGGLRWAFQSRRHGAVLSDSPDYDHALSACGAYMGAGPDRLTAAFDALVDLMRAELADRITADLTALLEDQLLCIEDLNGLVGDLHDWTSGRDVGELLKERGISTGRPVEPPADSAPPGPGEVRVVRAPGPVTYEPSEGEVAFAHDWVACALSIDFSARLEALQVGPRSEVAAANQPEIDRLAEQATDEIAHLTDLLPDK
ncbi:hypothetical protein [Cellulomonas uda]|nr:hypothetical protein [Cellulomonas uda]NII65342.1 hypothetical protein [Cellulomonas uda]